MGKGGSVGVTAVHGPWQFQGLGFEPVVMACRLNALPGKGKDKVARGRGFDFSRVVPRVKCIHAPLAAVG